MTGVVTAENTLRLLLIEQRDVLSASETVYHWLLLAEELLNVAESLSFVDGIFDTVLFRLFFSFLSFLVSAPMVPNLLEPDTNTGPAKMARLDDNEVVVIRDGLLEPFCPL